MYDILQNPTNKYPKTQFPLRDVIPEWRGFLFGGDMRICSVEGCEKKHHAKGYCKCHYWYFMEYGDPLISKHEMHGKTNTIEYHIWAAMIQRCLNIKDKRYKDYGGRGIMICDRWKKSFIAFYEDMGSRPFLKACIDRIDNDGNYEPKNVRWTTHKINVCNTRKTKSIMGKINKIREDYNYCDTSHRELAEKYKISKGTIWKILNNKHCTQLD